MGKRIVIFEDGKIRRGSVAQLIKRDKDRVLIRFFKYDYELGTEKLVTEWFYKFIPWYAFNKKEYKHNNKRKFAKYCHEESNEFYCDYTQTEEFKNDCKEWMNPEYYEKLFGEKLC